MERRRLEIERLVRLREVKVLEMDVEAKGNMIDEWSIGPA